MDEIKVKKVNEVYASVTSEASVEKELEGFFKFRPEGFQFNPRYRNKMWDGFVKLYSSNTGRIYGGLVPYVEKFASERGYQVRKSYNNDKLNITQTQVSRLIEKLRPEYGGVELQQREYQISSIYHCLKHKRATLLSATGSGKSFIIYCVMMILGALTKNEKNNKVLLVVPTIGLVSQMYDDFKEYSGSIDWDVEENCHMVTGGVEKETDKRITITTWQSIYKQPRKYFEQFGILICDECHQYRKAQNLQAISEKCVNAEYRYGTTGTLDDPKIHRLTIEGLFGPIFVGSKTKELIDQNYLSDIRIEALVIRYDDAQKQLWKGLKYQDEVKQIVTNEKRMRLIARLATTRKNNTLVLYNLVKDHGVPLYEQIQQEIKEKNLDKQVYIINGQTPADERERVRKLAEAHSNVIIVASYGTYSTGVNIKNLHHVILAAPSKSEIRVLQTIGRGLRLHDDKEYLKLYDFCDDIRTGKKKNYLYSHFLERIKFYDKEGFQYKLKTIKF